VKRAAVRLITIVVACVAGFGGAQLILRSPGLRDILGEMFNRHHLLALVNGQGIYQVDLDRRLAEMNYLAGIEHLERPNAEREAALKGLIAEIAAQARAASEPVSSDELKRQMNLLRFQFANEKAWNTTLSSSGFSVISLAKCMRKNLKTCAWISRQVANQLTTNDAECRAFYDAHLKQFFLPERRNVSHLFLAAPPETAQEIVDAKKAAIDALSVRLAAGEDFATLVAQNSEDDATKLRGGELGYFSGNRMPPEFVEAATKLTPAQVSKPVRTRLGFHILKLIGVQAPRQQTFDEVRNDVAIEIANQKRQIAIEKLSTGLAATASYLR
jgi:parvulin-like peptidyl-prolyl isomerase